MILCNLSTPLYIDSLNMPGKPPYYSTLRARSEVYKALINAGDNVYVANHTTFDPQTKTYKAHPILIDDTVDYGLRVDLTITHEITPNVVWQMRIRTGSENFLALNSPEIMRITGSQARTNEVLEKHQLPFIPSEKIQISKDFDVTSEQAWSDVLEDGVAALAQSTGQEKVVAKLTTTAASRGVHIGNLNELAGFFTKLSIEPTSERHPEPVLIPPVDVLLQPYIETQQPEGYSHGILRTIVVSFPDEEVRIIGTFWRVAKNGGIIKGDEDYFIFPAKDPYFEGVENIARQVAESFKQESGKKWMEIAVDTMVNRDGKVYILEINSSPMRITWFNKFPEAVKLARRWDEADYDLFQQLFSIDKNRV